MNPPANFAPDARSFRGHGPHGRRAKVTKRLHAQNAQPSRDDERDDRPVRRRSVSDEHQ